MSAPAHRGRSTLTCANAPGAKWASGRLPSVERVLFAPRELPPLPPDVSEDPGYAAWVRQREGERARQAVRPGPSPLVLVMLVGEAPAASVGRSLRALRAQTTSRWLLTLAATEPRHAELERLVRSTLPRQARRHLTWILASAGTPLPELLRQGLRSQEGAPVALLFPGDVWAPDAVALLGGAVTPTGVVYADEDTQPDGGAPQMPRLKPDYSPDFLLSAPYLGRPMAIGSALLPDLPELVATDVASLEHEIALDACARASSVVHVPEVLCHRAAAVSPTATGSAAHIERALARAGEAATVEPGRAPGTFHVARRTPTTPLVSVLVPFRDEPRLLRACVDSVIATTQECNIELLLIDNGSADPETLTLMELLAKRPGVRVLHDSRPFNWAALNNAGAAQARGEVLLFLNNDIQAHRRGWLAPLGAHARCVPTWPRWGHDCSIRVAGCSTAESWWA